MTTIVEEEDDFDHVEWKNEKFNIHDFLNDTIEHLDPPLPKLEPGQLVQFRGTTLYTNVSMENIVKNDEGITCKVIKAVSRSPSILIAVLDRVLYVMHPETSGWTSWYDVNVIEKDDV
jgi:hypothetical protein